MEVLYGMNFEWLVRASKLVTGEEDAILRANKLARGTYTIKERLL